MVFDKVIYVMKVIGMFVVVYFIGDINGILFCFYDMFKIIEV